MTMSSAAKKSHQLPEKYNMCYYPTDAELGIKVNFGYKTAKDIL